jgi:tRNA threonylcarbamoyladenosine biosynthesis protein TsaB
MSDVILSIDTSTPCGGVAVQRDGETAVVREFTSERSHNSQLFAPLREMLELISGTLRAIVVGTGPGSYTGVRIGIAAAQAIAISWDAAVIGLPSVLTVGSMHEHFFVCGDARRGSFFLAEVRHSRLVGDITLLDADGLRQRHRERRIENSWHTFDRTAPLDLDDVRCTKPSAARLAEIAMNLSGPELQDLKNQILQPVYLSAPFVTMPRK